MQADPLGVSLQALGAAPAAAAQASAEAAPARVPQAAAAPPGSALQRAQAGERGAFRELLLAHQASVFTLALRLLGSREDAQELAQDVFVLLHRHLARISTPAHLSFWLRRVVCHRALDRLRQRPRLHTEPLEAAERPAPDCPAGDPLLERYLRACVARIAPVSRAVLLLRYQEDLDPMEIARVMGLSVNTVKSHLRRTLARLRRQMTATDAGHG